ERLGGEQFYDKAREAESLTSTDPLEAFYLCVALGFQGKFGSNRLELQRWGERVYGRIASGGKPPERFLPDESREVEPIQPLPGKTVLLTVSILVSATALITLACFILAVHAT
ncbi:MAG: DotU family type IV/VI secretion system protein, partial [Isosphaeraceae bacterium]